MKFQKIKPVQSYFTQRSKETRNRLSVFAFFAPLREKRLKALLIILASFYALTAGSQQNKSTGWMMLNVPVGEDPRPVDLLKSYTNVYTMTIVSPNSVYCYENGDITKGVTYSLTAKNTLRSYILQRNKIADKNVFLVKGTAGALYKDMLAVLNLLIETKSRIFAIQSSTEEERNKFPAPTSMITTSSSRLPDTINLREHTIGAIFEFKSDTVILSAKRDGTKKDIDQSAVDHIEKLQEDWKKLRESAAGTRLNIYIIGDKSTRHEWFMKLVNFLRSNEIYRFYLLVK